MFDSFRLQYFVQWNRETSLDCGKGGYSTTNRV